MVQASWRSALNPKFQAFQPWTPNNNLKPTERSGQYMRRLWVSPDSIQARLRATSRWNFGDLDPLAVSDPIPWDILLLFTFLAEPRSAQNICSTVARSVGLQLKANWRSRPWKDEFRASDLVSFTREWELKSSVTSKGLT